MHIDHARIKQVTEDYGYATFSHTWEDNESLFEKVLCIVVYDLEESTTHDKLQMFCKIVREAGFNSAWSDTCFAMFKWFEGSAMTIIFIRGVRSPSRYGDLMGSVWNTRAWTFSEMEEATRRHSGLNDIWEKLCLASRREITLVEDATYSLLGIFSIFSPVVYGEGDEALGRLLKQLLASSGDTSILAWIWKSGSFNNCLLGNVTVFEQPPPPHVPPTTESAEMEAITARLRNSLLNVTLVTKLYD
ncbi:hypothetical protein OG21DRAFT_1522296 [Imleria badia]|nr:hypothetical protein OG21DRAFT_1522296 [Imleria badia]